MKKQMLVLIALGCLCVVLAGCPTVGTPVTEAWIGISVRVTDPGTSVLFQDKSQLVDEEARAWQWDFGDGSFSDAQNVSHAYAAPGAYTVSLTLTTDKAAYTRTETNMVAVRSAGDTPAEPGEERTFGEIVFAWIPPGSFSMGDESAAYTETDNDPVHTATISHGFWMSKYEITQSDWNRVMRIPNPSYFPAATGYEPVESVTWEQAQEFIVQMNKLENGTFRLPTEAEWEYACRAGTTTQWCFGDDPDTLPQYGWSFATARAYPQPTGLLLPNAWGLHDMHGNIAEWCQDYFDDAYYANGDVTDPPGMPGSSFRVVRGGSWYSPAHQTRSAYRDWAPPNYTDNEIGFRICRN